VLAWNYKDTILGTNNDSTGGGGSFTPEEMKQWNNKAKKEGRKTKGAKYDKE